MNHRKFGRKLGVKSKHREAMLRNMVTSLFEHEKIQTTVTRAKELRRVAEKLITITKRGGDPLAARRLAMKKLRSREIAAKLFNEIGPRFAQVPGGYTKILRVGQRLGDAAPLGIIRLLDADEAQRASKGKKKKRRRGKAQGGETATAVPPPSAASGQE